MNIFLVAFVQTFNLLLKSIEVGSTGGIVFNSIILFLLAVYKIADRILGE